MRLNPLQISEQAPQLSTTTTQASSRPALDAQAQKLKALVKKSQEQRAKSGTPPGPGARQLRSTEGTSSLRDSPIIPGGSSDDTLDNTAKNPSTNEAVEALLSEMKASTDPNTKDTKKQNNSSLSKPHQSKTAEKGKISPTPKDTPQDWASRSNNEVRKMVNRKKSNGESSDASEGEIRENVSRSSKQLAGQKEGHTSTRPVSRDEQVLNKRRDEQSGKIPRISETRGQSPLPSSRALILRNRNERHEEIEERSEKKNYHPTNKYERSHVSEPEQKTHQRDLRDRSEEGRKQEIKYERKEESSRKSEVSTLAQILELDEDLRDWLNYTGYHKTEYRNKVLNRRRAIAALDAQKAKLLEEMELDERRGLQTTDTSQTAASMLPPPIPTKISTVSVPAKKTNDATDRGSSNQAQQAPTKDIGVKRTYTEYQEPRGEGTSEKIGRLDEQGRGVRIKGESQADDHRSYHNSAHERYNRRSPSADSKTYRHEDRDTVTEGRGRGRERNYSQESEMSFNMRTYENRTLARSKSYDFPEPEERFDHDDRFSGRQFMQVGNYKGRAYDPNFRYRGRGRGSWTTSHDTKPRPQSSYPNPQITSMKPYKDPRPLDRGGRGGQ
jgi:YTH domain-containing protein 1